MTPATVCTCSPGWQPTGHGTELTLVIRVVDPWCLVHGDETGEVEG